MDRGLLGAIHGVRVSLTLERPPHASLRHGEMGARGRTHGECGEPSCDEGASAKCAEPTCDGCLTDDLRGLARNPLPRTAPTDEGVVDGGNTYGLMPPRLGWGRVACNVTRGRKGVCVVLVLCCGIYEVLMLWSCLLTGGFSELNRNPAPFFSSPSPSFSDADCLSVDKNFVQQSLFYLKPKFRSGAGAG